MRSKTLWMAATLLIAFVNLRAIGGTLIWHNQNTSEMLNLSGTYVLALDNWYYELIRVSDSSILQSKTTWEADGFLSNNSFVTDGGFSVFARVYNNNSKGLATYFYDAPSYAVPSFELPGDLATYNVTPSTSADWQLVPEPGTMALMGVGLLIVGIRRKIMGR